MKKIILTSFAIAMSAMCASAASLENLMVKDYSKKPTSAYQIAVSAPLMTLWYVGSSTGAVVDIKGDTFKTEVPFGTADLSLNLAAAAYDTLGELCDYIDADSDYECQLTGGKRDDDSSFLIDVNSAADGSGEGEIKVNAGYSIIQDTTTAGATYINRVGITPESGRRVVLKFCEVQTDAIGTLKVYGKLSKFTGSSDGVTRNDTTQVFSAATADDTAETDGNLYNGYWLEFGQDEHVVISAGNASTAQTTTSFISCYWDEK